HGKPIGIQHSPAFHLAVEYAVMAVNRFRVSERFGAGCGGRQTCGSVADESSSIHASLFWLKIKKISTSSKPDRIIFVDMARDRDVLWAMEEALKYDGQVMVRCASKRGLGIQ